MFAPPATRRALASLYILKKLDLKPEEGGEVIPVLLPAELAPLEELLEELAVAGTVAIDRKRQAYVLTPQGIAEIGLRIDEIEGIIDEFADTEPPEMIATLRARNLDVLRIRFLWGWYDGEFDDVVHYQERRGFPEIERDWAAFILSDAFYADLERDLADA